MENQIVIYQADNGQTSIEVRLENENVWLTTDQMSVLFEREGSNIRRHIINVFKEGELSRENNVHFLHVNGVKKPVPFYNLDVIISVGYRVKSQRGVQFRQWANKVLKAYLLNGYVVNEKIRKRQIGELRQLVQMLGRTIQNQPLLKTDENQALFDIVVDYTYALDTLDDYDYQRLGVKETTHSSPRTIRSATATNALRPRCSYGSSTTTESSTMWTAASALPTTPWSP
jgi:hypothetical protein